MARAQYAVIGGRELRRTLKAAEVGLGDLKAANQAVGNVVATQGKATSPRQSSALAGSVRASRIASGVTIRAGSAGIPYAGPIHWGWPAHNIQAQPFLSEAATSTEPVWLALYETEIDRIVSTIRGE